MKVRYIGPHGHEETFDEPKDVGTATIIRLYDIVHGMQPYRVFELNGETIAVNGCHEIRRLVK